MGEGKNEGGGDGKEGEWGKGFGIGASRVGTVAHYWWGRSLILVTTTVFLMLLYDKRLFRTLKVGIVTKRH